MGNYIELTGAERMRPRLGDLIVFPSEPRNHRRLRVGASTLRKRYAMAFCRAVGPWQSTYAVTDLQLANDEFAKKSETPFACVVTHLATTYRKVGLIRRVTNSIDEIAENDYPDNVEAVITNYVEPQMASARMAEILARITYKSARSIANGDTMQHGRLKLVPWIGLDDAVAQLDGRGLKDDLEHIMHSANERICDMTTTVDDNKTVCAVLNWAADLQTARSNLQAPRQFAIPQALLADEDVRVLRIVSPKEVKAAFLAYARTVSSDRLMRFAGIAAKESEKLSALQDELEKRAIELDSLSAGVETVTTVASKLAGEAMALAATPDIPQAEPMATAQEAADALRAKASERREA